MVDHRIPNRLFRNDASHGTHLRPLGIPSRIFCGSIDIHIGFCPRRHKSEHSRLVRGRTGLGTRSLPIHDRGARRSIHWGRAQLFQSPLASAGDIVGFGRRAVAYGMVGASAEAGGVIGPLWGGTINEWIGWEFAFWFNIPLAVIAAAVLLLMPSGKTNQVKVDWLASTIFAFALTASTLAVFRISGPRHAHVHPRD